MLWDAAVTPHQAPSKASGGWAWPTALLLVALASFMVAAGCGLGAKRGAPGRQQPPAARWTRPQTFDDTGKAIEEQDIDGDGNKDLRRVLRRVGDPSSIERAEWDLNRDGRVDVWAFYDAAGELTHEEMDLDWDGTLDLRDFYEAGQLVRREVAANFLGQVSVRRLYDRGILTTVEQDTDGDGQVDTWEFYEKGKLVRIGRDTNADGVEDHFTTPTEAYRKKAEQDVVAPARGHDPRTPGDPDPSAPAPQPAPPAESPPSAPAPGPAAPPPSAPSKPGKSTATGTRTGT